MTITREQVELLSRIYNTMLNIGTKGEDTLIMADCLRALEQVISQVSKTSEPAAAVESAQAEQVE